MSKIFELLKEGLNDIIKHQKGKKKLKKYSINILEPATAYSARDVKKIRESLNYPTKHNTANKNLNLSNK